MQATVIKIGNSLGFKLPDEITNGYPFKEGLNVDIQDNGNKFIIELIKQNNPYNLADMLNGITKNNIHQSIDTGICLKLPKN